MAQFCGKNLSASFKKSCTLVNSENFSALFTFVFILASLRITSLSFIICSFCFVNLNLQVLYTGADLGGGGDAPPPLRESTFDTFSEIHFWPTDPKVFLKAPSAPVYTNFEGERAPKNARPKNGFFDCFFKNLPAAHKIYTK